MHASWEKTNLKGTSGLLWIRRGWSSQEWREVKAAVEADGWVIQPEDTFFVHHAPDDIYLLSRP